MLSNCRNYFTKCLGKTQTFKIMIVEVESRPEIENEDSDEEDAEISFDVKQMDGTIKNVILTKDPKQSKVWL